MKSMTGYGLGKAQSSTSSIEVSLRSVNGRFLESRLHLPREFMQFEGELKKILGRYIQRGTIDVFVSRKVKLGSGGQKVHLNAELAGEYMKAYRQLAKQLKLRSEVKLEALARLPEVVKLEESGELPGDEKKALLVAFEKACKACAIERKREGKSLRDDLETILSALELEIDGIHALREEANQNLLQRFEQKIKSRLNGVEVDPARISQEVVMQIERSDINEELIRLKEHTKNYRQLFSSAEAQGKKLDFYTQELLREVNTIGSKSSVSKLTQIVVEAKTLIERLREQVQNLE